MKHGTTLTLMLAAALAAAPALAQTGAASAKPAAPASSAAVPAASAAAGAGEPASKPVPTATTGPAGAATTAPAATPAGSASAPAPGAAATPANAAAAPAPAAAAGGTDPSATADPAARPGPLAMTIPTPQPSGAGAGGLLQTTFALLFVLALLVGGAWFLKRYGPRNLGGGGGAVKLVGSLSLGARERILVLEVGGQWIVVGASPGRINALATMARQDHGDAALPAALPTANFAEWFKQTIDKRNGK